MACAISGGPGQRTACVAYGLHAVARSLIERLHHFVSAGVWDNAPLEAALLHHVDHLVGGEHSWLIIDDTSLPKKGEHSVGVAPQYTSTLSKKANCQTLMSVNWLHVKCH